MLVNIRGTSGSGKSTVVRAIMALYPNRSRIFLKARKRPLGYVLNRPEGKPLFVVGHYETDCGGCDTIPTINDVYNIVHKAHEEGFDVLFEGLLISAEYRRTEALREIDNLLVVGMDLSLSECLDSVNKRRLDNWQRRVDKTKAYNDDRAVNALAKGRKLPKPRPLPPQRPPVKERNTKSKWKATQTIMSRLQTAGVQAEWHSRESAVQRIREAFQI